MSTQNKEHVVLSETVVKKYLFISHSHPNKKKEITPLLPDLQSLHQFGA